MSERPEPAPGQSSGDQNVWRSASEKGGSVTVHYNTDDFLANTVGQIGTLPTHLFLWTPEAVFKKPTREMAEELFEKAKTIPLKGDLDLHIGHSSLLNELRRTFQKDIKGRPNIFLRTLGLPLSLMNAIGAKLTRANYYNPLTHAAYIFHPNKYIAMHELGHGEMYDRLKHPGILVGARMALGALSVLAGVPGIAAAAGDIGLTLGVEAVASQNVLNMLEKPKQQKALHVLLPAFGTYVGQAFIQGKNRIFPAFFPTSLKQSALYAAAVLAGHIVARTPDAYKRIRTIFAPRSQETRPALLPASA
jgi:hypothetical protein